MVRGPRLPPDWLVTSQVWHANAARIQAGARGRFCRDDIRKMRWAADYLQRIARGARARAKAKEEARRGVEGAKVETVFAAGRRVSGADLVLTVARCGLNFRCVGQDVARGTTHKGIIPRDAVLRLLQQDNAAHPDRPPVRPGQAHRVLAVLLDNLALVDPIPGVPRQLCTGDKVLVCESGRGHEVAGAGLAARRMGRLLADSRTSLKEHNEKVAKKNAARAARGLPPAVPTPLERMVAKQRWKAKLGDNPVPAHVMAKRRKEARKRAREREARKEAKAKAAKEAAGGGDDATATVDDDDEESSEEESSEEETEAT